MAIILNILLNVKRFQIRKSPIFRESTPSLYHLIFEVTLCINILKAIVSVLYNIILKTKHLFKVKIGVAFVNICPAQPSSWFH